MSTDVLMVSVPFAPLGPSLGLSQLQACLREVGIDSSIWYATLDFAAETGVSAYRTVSESPFTPDLTGDFLFSTGLRGQSDEAWWTEVWEGRHPAHRKPADLRGDVTRQVLETMQAAVVPSLDRWVDHIVRAAPQVLALTSVFAQNVAALALAGRVKARRPETLICLGGANAEGPMGEALFDSYPFLDVVVSGEGEYRFPALVAAWLAGRPLPRYRDVWARERLLEHGPARTHAAVDLAALPAPDYGDFFEQMEDIGLRLHFDLPFETSRGCWWGQKHHCTFCGLNGATMAFRRKPADVALAQLGALRERYPGRRVLLVDNILDMSYFRDFLPTLARQADPPGLFCEVKANLTREQMTLLKSAGAQCIQPGIESLSDDVLRLMKKGLRGIQAVKLLREGARLGIDIEWNIIAGFPGESPSEYQRMADTVPHLTHLPPPHFCSPLRLDRFSPLHTQADGLLDVHAYPAYRHVYGLPDATLDRLACCFSFRYADGRDVEAYLAPLSAAVARWRERPARLEAVVRDHEVDIVDTREAALRYRLQGVAADVLQACDEPVSRQRLLQMVPGAATALETLEARHLLLTDGGWHLALPIFKTEIAALSLPTMH